MSLCFWVASRLLEIVVADPLERFVLHRVLAVLEAHRRVELLQLAPDKGRPVVCGVLLRRCSVVATTIILQGRAGRGGKGFNTMLL